MREGACLVFIEVRERNNPAYGGAAGSISPTKQRRILRAAKFYLLRFAKMPPCRIDVVALDGERVNWIRNAILDEM